MTDAIALHGSPENRGRAQAAARPDAILKVRETVAARLAPLRDRMASPGIARYLARQRDFATTHCGAELAEMAGVASGFGIAGDDLFAYLHAAILAGDAPVGPDDVDGCTTLVAPSPDGGAVMAKNRDLSARLLPLQAVFRHALMPERPDRVVLAVGSLGAPGAYSSGFNEAGFALADTAIPSRRYGVGWLRYLLMTHLLMTCDTVAEALAFIRAVPHAGGGSLALADRTGATAMVELAPADLGGPVIAIGGPLARTNHFLAAPLAAPPTSATSIGRLKTADAALTAHFGAWTTQRIARLMAGHDAGDRTGLCRHGDDDGAATLSTAIYRTASPVLTIAVGPPCHTSMEDFRLDPKCD